MSMAATLDAAVANRWDTALLVAKLFAIDPAGLGGIVVRAGPSAARDFWLDFLRRQVPPGTPLRRLPTGIADDRLLGGIDLVATLKAGRPITQNGLLIEADGGIVLIPMAERVSVHTAARIAAALDRRAVLIAREGIARTVSTSFGVIAFDEGVSPDEAVPAQLAERLAFQIDLEGLSARGLENRLPDLKIEASRNLLPKVAPASREIIEALVVTASHFGIASMVSPLLALRAARAAAALAGRDHIIDEDAALAARLVLAPRAMTIPDSDASDAEPETQQTDQPQEPPQDGADQAQDNAQRPLEDVVRDAVKAALPPGLLEMLKSGATKSAASRRHGKSAPQISLLRGRPVGVRIGPIRSGARLALVETLRAAAPWQPVRRAEAKRGAATKRAVPKRVDVRPEDFRIKKFSQPRESSVLFCVDASGSSAFHRLAEAKGAVELLLAEAYVARTYAALIAFRGARAELLLPPSRSLTRAKALLSTLPGGGGTPLAAGIEAAMVAALAERAKGRVPLIVFLTDGHANIARDGQASRSRALQDAMGAAAQLGAQRLNCVFVDTARRIRAETSALAGAMQARYLALPYAQAANMRDLIHAAMP